MNDIKIIILIIILNCIGCDINLNQPRIYTNRIPVLETKLIIPIYIDYAFSNDEKNQIFLGINEWNYVLNRQIILKIVDVQFDMSPNKIQEALNNYGIMVLKIDNNSVSIPKGSCIPNDASCQTIAWTDDFGGHELKIVSDRIDIKYEHNIVLHEIGHLLWLRHTSSEKNNINSVMYPSFIDGGYVCIDKSSALKVAQHYNLDQNRINFCEN